MINYFFVHSSGRQKFEELKIAADKDNSRYYVGTNFSRSYEGEPSPHCEYDSLIFLSGDDAQIITHGTKIPLSAITPSGDSATLRFETAEDSYNLVDPGITDALEVGAKIIVHTNYEDLSQPTTFATPWNDNNKVVFFPDDHTPDYLFDAGVEVNSLALISNFGYTMMYIGDVDGTDVWMVLNASGTEPNGLQLLQPQYLTDNQKIAVYRYMASVNATGERIANSLNIDYCLYEEQTDNDVKLFRIVVKYVDANIKCDYYEGKTADGSTFITNSCTDIDPHDLIPIIAEFDTIKLLCKDIQEDIKAVEIATHMYVLDYTNTAHNVVNLKVNELLSNININDGVSVVLTPRSEIIIGENILGVKITDANNSMSPSGANIYCQIYDNTGKLFKGVISKTVCCTWLGQAIYLPFAANENLALLTAGGDNVISEGDKYIMIDDSNSDAYIDVDSNETEVNVVFVGVNHNETVIYFDGGTTISLVIYTSTYNIVGEVPNFEAGTKYVMAIKDNYVVFGTVAADEEEEE